MERRMAASEEGGGDESGSQHGSGDDHGVLNEEVAMVVESDEEATTGNKEVAAYGVDKATYADRKGTTRRQSVQ